LLVPKFDTQLQLILEDEVLVIIHEYFLPQQTPSGTELALECSCEAFPCHDA
jgi:hypothetical protein